MDNSLFARLPAELRNTIYYMVLVSTAGIEIDSHDRRYKDIAGVKKYVLWDQDGRSMTAMPSLLAVCRQVRSETLALFLHSNKLVVPLSLVFRDDHFPLIKPQDAFHMPKGLLPLGRKVCIRIAIGDKVKGTFSTSDLDDQWRTLGPYLAPILRVIRPEEVEVQLDVPIHRFGLNASARPKKARVACDKDVPLSVFEAGHISVAFNPVTVMRKEMDDLFAAKRAQIDTHSDSELHAGCKINEERVALLEGLEHRKDMVVRILERMPQKIFKPAKVPKYQAR